MRKGHNGPRYAREVQFRLLWGKPATRQQGGDRGGLVNPGLEHDRAPRRQQARGVGGDRPISCKAVDTAIERNAGLAPYFGREQLELVARYVGRIRNNQIEPADERPSEIAAQHSGAMSQSQRTDVVPRKRKRLEADVDADA